MAETRIGKANAGRDPEGKPEITGMGAMKIRHFSKGFSEPHFWYLFRIIHVIVGPAK